MSNRIVENFDETPIFCIRQGYIDTIHPTHINLYMSDDKPALVVLHNLVNISLKIEKADAIALANFILVNVKP